MKTYIICALLVYSILENNAFAENFLIKDFFKVIGRPAQIQLVPSIPLSDHKLVLDCFSFIDGLHYIKLESLKWTDEWFIPMDENVCEEAIQWCIDYSSKTQVYCLRIDNFTHNVNFDFNLSDCF